MSNQAINSFDTYRKFRTLVLQLIFENNIFKESRKEQKIKTLANIKQDELQFIDLQKRATSVPFRKL